MTSQALNRPMDVSDVIDDPHLFAVADGLANRAFGCTRAVEILESCGYTHDEARAALAAIGSAK